MPSSPPSRDDADPPLVALRVYPTLAAARAAALALAARSWAYEIDRSGATWTLLVEAPRHTEAEAELRVFEAEERAPRSAPTLRAFGHFSPGSLLLAGTILVGIFLAQERSRFDLLELGEADSRAIIGRGEWWRCLTALTLHGDLSHIAGNLATGALFAGFLIPQLGTGLTWLLVLLSGGLGNLLNAWLYRADSHHSIGASTAVFAALGLLVSGEALHRWRSTQQGSWRLLVPSGAGLALLAFLGVGDKHDSVDFMAHGWGLLAGGVLGWPAAGFGWRERIGTVAQWVAGLVALGLLTLAWGEALSR